MQFSQEKRDSAPAYRRSLVTVICQSMDQLMCHAMDHTRKLPTSAFGDMFSSTHCGTTLGHILVCIFASQKNEHAASDNSIGWDFHRQTQMVANLLI